MKTEKRKTGDIGEKTVANHLERLGYSIIEKNYLRKWGEIDLVVRKDQIVHFVEVKTVSREIRDANVGEVSHGTYYRPEENVHTKKLKKLGRAVQTWIEENKYDGEWQVDVAALVLDCENKKAMVKIIENIILDI